LTTRSLRFGLLAAALVVLAGVLSGCAGGQQGVFLGSSWPGIATGEESIFVAFGPSVYAVDPESGTTRWRYPAEPQRGQTFYAEPAVADDLVVVGDYGGNLIALNPETGDPVWVFEANGTRFIAGAAIGDEVVYAGSTDGMLHALDRATGERIWTFRAKQGIWARPLIIEDTVYVASLDKHLYALDARTGQLEWQFPANDADLDEPMGAIVSAPTYYEGMLIFGSFNNRVYALDAEMREIVWRYEAENWVWSSPVVEEESGVVVGADLDGNVFALDAATGAEELWTVELPGPVVGAPTIAETESGSIAVYVATADRRGQSRLYKLNLENGENLAPPVDVEVEFPSRFLFIQTGTSVRSMPIYTSPVIYDGMVLVGVHEGESLVFALDRETLLEVWSFEPASS